MPALGAQGPLFVCFTPDTGGARWACPPEVPSCKARNHGFVFFLLELRQGGEVVPPGGQAVSGEPTQVAWRVPALPAASGVHENHGSGLSTQTPSALWSRGHGLRAPLAGQARARLGFPRGGHLKPQRLWSGLSCPRQASRGFE